MKTETTNERGHQRLSLEKLKAWEALGYGMFLHFGMSTYDGDELSKGDKPSTFYAPDKLDVDQWTSIARDAGIQYAVLTTKHVSGHCLWPSRHTDYHVGTSGNKTDVVEAFVRACEKRGVMPGFYYCAWDNHHHFDSITPNSTGWMYAYSTPESQEFQWKQLTELLTSYGKIGEIWLDIPWMNSREFRHKLYAHLAKLQPDALIVTNSGFGDGTKLQTNLVWPTDVVTMERWLPNSKDKFRSWREVEGKQYYMPGEVCDPIGDAWFYQDNDQPRSDAELLGMYMVSRGRNANLLLNVGPDKHGLIPDRYRDALMRLRRNIDRIQV